MNIELFDLDGTLTEEFSPSVGDKTGLGLKTYSLWNLITRELVADRNEFDQKADLWKKMVTSTPNIDKTASSKDMTDIGIRLFQEQYRNSESIIEKAAEITKIFFRSGLIVSDAIRYLDYRLRSGTICVISTASYEDGAIGFVKGLVECYLLEKTYADKIIFSGTKIDWGRLQVSHMNVDKNKLIGIENVFKLPMEQIKPKIFAVFGDDPEINDKALLEVGKHSFAIKTHKNLASALPVNCVFSNWAEIFKCKDNLSYLHAGLKQRSKL